jgi:hypothetical protein
MPAGSTYEPIATTTLSSALGTVTFSSISAGYTDLVLVGMRRYSNVGTGAQNTFIRFNNDSTSLYSTTYLLNGGSGRITGVNSLYTSAGGNEVSDRYSIDVWNIFNYSNTNIFKTALLNYNFANNHKQIWCGLYRSKSAIDRIDVIGDGGATFAIGSTFTLYGITAA